MYLDFDDFMRSARRGADAAWQEGPYLGVPFLYRLHDEHSFAPSRAHRSDAGFDLFTPYGFEVNPGCGRIVWTGVSIALPAGTYVQLGMRSGLSSKRIVAVAFVVADVLGGVIDSGYRGDIGVMIENRSSEPHFIGRGKAIAQMIRHPFGIFDDPVQLVSLPPADRGLAGFGSTDAGKGAGR